MQPFNASNKPGTCLWCGRKLPRPAHTTYEDTDKPPKRCGHWPPDYYGSRKVEPCGSREFTRDKPGWRCENGHYLEARRKLRSRTYVYEKPGAYGDGFFCGQSCGYAFGRVLADHGRRLQPKKG